ncbi:MAG: CHASE2 domain-containing protein, partial [Alphaproteobacteria bacterium]|nr:CHASE2 domain-containing protein [Alphaproteobacteria bacterium]
MRRLFAWEILLSAAISTVMLVLFVTFGDRGLPLRLEAETLNVRFWLRPTHPPPVPVVIIEIDDASIGEIGRWPWSRRIFAELLDRIHTAGAGVTCLDLLLTEPEPSLLQTQLETVETAMAPLLRKLDPATRAFAAKLIAELSQNTDPDAQLAAAIERDRPVILPFALDLQPGATNPGGPARPPPVLARAALDRARGDRDELLPPAFGAQLPVAALAGGGLLAHVTTVPDGLGGYLYDYPVLRVADEYLPSLSLEAVRVFLGIPKSDVIVDRGRGIDLGAFYIPTDRGMRLVVNYYPPGTFQKVSFANALFDRAPLQNLNGKIVLIGGGAKALGDAVPTPYDPALSGAERHATLIANFLGRDFLRRDGTTIGIDASLLVLVSLSVGFFARRGAVPAVIGAVVLLTGLVIVDYFAFVRFGLWFDFTFPAAAIVLCAAASVGGKYLGEWRRERYIRDAFSRYLHPHLVEELCRIRAP